jgi:transposase
MDQLRIVETRLDEQLTEMQNQAENTAPEVHRDVAIMLSFPGLGTMTAATLLAEASQPLRDRSYHTLRALSGAAPVTRRSGKGRPRVIMRKACNDRLRNALYHWSRVAAQVDPYCKAQYAALRARGKEHGRACRTVADRLLKVLCAALANGSLYDPALRRGRQPK